MSDTGQQLFRTQCNCWISAGSTTCRDVPSDEHDCYQQVVLAVPKRLRPYLLYDRALLGDLSRVAARTITAFIRTTVGEPGLSVGIVASIQTQVKSNIEYPTRNLE